jgi:Zn-finger nucleic acid-binding protein
MRIVRDQGLLICDHCGSQRDAPSAAEHVEVLGESSQRCPVCSIPLLESRLHGHQLLSCARCGGVLIDMSRFTEVIDAVRANDVGTFRATMPRRQNPGERTLDCPSCGQPFVSHHYGGPGNVVIDTCSRCLVNWLDQGELRRIALAPERQR